MPLILNVLKYEEQRGGAKRLKGIMHAADAPVVGPGNPAFVTPDVY